MYVLGLAAAVVASVLFNVGIALQGLAARDAPKRQSLRMRLLWTLFRRPRWVLGWVLGIVGIGPQVLALAFAPFVVVQPALAVGLLLLLAIGSRAFGESVGIAEVAGVVAIIGGIALVSWGAPPHAEAHRGAFATIGVFGAMSAAGLIPFAGRGTRVATGLASAAASGCAFGATNIATKLMSDALGGGHILAAIGWAAGGVVTGVAATITGMSAFQTARATAVVPLSTAVQTFLPIVCEPLFLRERWSSSAVDGLPIAAGLALALVGTVVLCRTRAVSALAKGASS